MLRPMHSVTLQNNSRHSEDYVTFTVKLSLIYVCTMQGLTSEGAMGSEGSGSCGNFHNTSM